ncbi:uncharacterized protein LOC121831528 isoform X2 [Peromyscus maniculatus bairdii]|uniref:uncharacterized protein LOC121831528 isoform X2 n=1 Tax=Peromyscus maniculatus bairdii TaxID=230844 RepID=UPI003FCF5EE8
MSCTGAEREEKGRCSSWRARVGRPSRLCRSGRGPTAPGLSGRCDPDWSAAPLRSLWMTQRPERPSSGSLDGKSSLPAGSAFAELLPPGRRARVLRLEGSLLCGARPGGAVRPPETALGALETSPGARAAARGRNRGTAAGCGVHCAPASHRPGAGFPFGVPAPTSPSCKPNCITLSFFPSLPLRKRTIRPPATGRNHATTPFSSEEFRVTSAGATRSVEPGGHLTGRLVCVP